MILCCILFLILLLFFPEVAVTGSRYGTTLWLTQLLPTLLPFFIAIRLFDMCLPNVAEKRCFLLTGILCGYPAGASLVMTQYTKGLLSRRQAYFYLGFVNNPSPMFVLVFCGTSILGLSAADAFFLFGILIFSSFSGSLFFLWMQKIREAVKAKNRKQENTVRAVPSKMSPLTASMSLSGQKAETLSERLDTIILDSFTVLLKIGGYVIIFCIFGQFMKQILPENSVSTIVFSGLLEITSGVSYLQTAVLPVLAKKVLMMIILTFGGLSAAAQTSSVISKSELSILPYIINKGINSIIAALFSLFLFRMF